MIKLKFIKIHPIIFVPLILGTFIGVGLALFFNFGGIKNPNLYVPPEPGTSYLTPECQQKQSEAQTKELPLQTQVNIVNNQLNQIGELTSFAGRGDILSNTQYYDKTAHTKYANQVNTLDQQYLSLEQQINTIQVQYRCN